MVPDSVNSLIAFALLVAPGLTYELLLQRRRHRAWNDSTFVEISRTVLASAVFSFISSTILYLIFVATLAIRVESHQLHALLKLWSSPSEFVDVLPWWTAISISVLGCVLAVAWHRYRQLTSTRKFTVLPAFSLTMEEGKAVANSVLVLARTKEGVSWKGEVQWFGITDDGRLRDLVLGPPLSRASEPRVALETVSEWERVYLPGDALESVRFAYLNVTSEVEERTSGIRKLRLRLSDWVHPGPPTAKHGHPEPKQAPSGLD